MMHTVVNFEIQKIYAGWFDVLFKINDREVVVTASDAWGNDAPRLLLQILNELQDKTIHNKYVIWDEEPGIYIIFMNKLGQDCNIKIAFSESCHDELTTDIRNVIGDLSYEEMKSRLDDLELLLACNDVYFVSFIRSVIRAFEEYENSADYRENWMEFSHEELTLMKQYLKA